MTVSQSTLKLLVAEDHELARYGLCMALEERGTFSIVGEAENGVQAVDLSLEHQPDVILMDISMPVQDGISATLKIKSQLPKTKIVMLTSRKENEEILASLAAGADAYCMKDIKIDRLCQVIDMVMEGAIWLDPAIAQVVMQALPGNSGAETDTASAGAVARKRYNTELTEREYEVLSYIVQGKSNKEIAVLLGVTIHTAKAHVGNIIQKLAVDDRTQVAVKALQEGLIKS